MGDEYYHLLISVSIARGKQAYQSSTILNSGANRAVDGDLTAVFKAGSCTHTRRERAAWWATDLGAVTHIALVIITNRRDCCCK